MFQWAVSLEITGACPAPGRFSSELLNPVSRACDFQRYQVSLATHSPNGKTDSMPGCMFQQPMRLSSASHLSDGWQESVFPTASAVQTVGEVVEDAPEHLNQNDDKNTQCLKTVCKTSPVNRLF